MEDIDLHSHTKYRYEQVNEMYSLLAQADEDLYEPDRQCSELHGDKIARYHGLGKLVNLADELRHCESVLMVELFINNDPEVSNAVKIKTSELPQKALEMGELRRAEGKPNKHLTAVVTPA